MKALIANGAVQDDPDEVGHRVRRDHEPADQRRDQLDARSGVVAEQHGSSGRRDGPRRSEAVPVRHPGRWVAGAVVLLLVAIAVHSVATNPRFGWGTFGDYFFDRRILHGVVRHARAHGHLDGDRHRRSASCSRSCGCRRTRSSAASSWIYIWFFRGTPVLVQILFWNFISALYPRISLGIPFGGPELAARQRERRHHAVRRRDPRRSGSTRRAYMAEIVRAGILSVDEGQTEAAHALGMTRLQTMRRIVLPAGDAGDHPADRQRDDLDAEDDVARRASSPYTELLYSAQLIYSVNYQTDPAAARGEHLVPGRHLGALDRPVLPRAPLRARRRARRCPTTPLAAACAATSSRSGTRASTPRPRRSRTDDATPMVKAEERPQALRPPRGAQGHRPRGRSPAR